MQKDFEGKVVIVTGSSSGIGEAIAILFAKRGASVTLCGRNKDRLQANLEKCKTAAGGANAKFITVCGDVTKKEVREKILDDTVKHFGRLDVLVCNHGDAVFEKGNETEEEYDTIMNTNLKSVYFLIRSAIPHLEKTKGNVVNVSSISSTMANGFLIYSCSKAALDHMTRMYALQLAPKGIRVNSINPTFVMTRLLDKVGFDKSLLAKVSSTHPLYGRASTPEEQADVAAFLASNAANFVTGQCVLVDGGITLSGTTYPDKE